MHTASHVWGCQNVFRGPWGVCHFPGRFGWGTPSLPPLPGPLVPRAEPAHSCHPRAYLWSWTRFVLGPQLPPPRGPRFPGLLTHPVSSSRPDPAPGAPGALVQGKPGRQGVGAGETERPLEGGNAEAPARPRRGQQGQGPGGTEEALTALAGGRAGCSLGCCLVDGGERGLCGPPGRLLGQMPA